MEGTLVASAQFLRGRVPISQERSQWCTPAHTFVSQLRARGGTISTAWQETPPLTQDGPSSPEEQRWSSSCPSCTMVQHTRRLSPPPLAHRTPLYGTNSLCFSLYHRYLDIFSVKSPRACPGSSAWTGDSEKEQWHFYLQDMFGVIICPYLSAYIYKPLLHKKSSSALTYLATWSKIAWSYSCCLTYFFFM